MRASKEWMEAESRLREIEHILDIGVDGRDGPPRSSTEKGTPYTTYVTGGKKEEGGPFPILTADPREGVDLWIKTVMKDALPHKRLVWRTRPELTFDSDNSDDPYKPKMWKVRARLAFEFENGNTSKGVK